MKKADFDAEAISKEAVNVSMEVLGTPLDFSVASLDQAEEIIQRLRSMYRKKYFDKDVCWNLTVILGTYIGEVMLKDKLGAMGYSWQINEYGLPVVMNSKTGNYCSPISKVQKKLENTSIGGDEEGTASSFYRTYLLIIRTHTGA
jgi:hypothetical protein